MRARTVKQLADAFVVASRKEDEVEGLEREVWISPRARLLPRSAVDHLVVLCDGVPVCTEERLRPPG